MPFPKLTNNPASPLPYLLHSALYYTFFSHNFSRHSTSFIYSDIKMFSPKTFAFGLMVISAAIPNVLGAVCRLGPTRAAFAFFFRNDEY